MTPPGPLPRSVAISTPASRAARRTSGEITRGAVRTAAGTAAETAAGCAGSGSAADRRRPVRRDGCAGRVPYPTSTCPEPPSTSDDGEVSGCNDGCGSTRLR